MLIGVVLSYVWQGAPEADWEKSHFRFHIRSFWIGIALGLIVHHPDHLTLGWPASILYPLIVLWLIIRSLVALTGAATAHRQCRHLALVDVGQSASRAGHLRSDTLAFASWGTAIMTTQILDMIARMGGADGVAAMASRVGLTPEQAQMAMAALAPAVAGGMAKQAQAGNGSLVDELARACGRLYRLGRQRRGGFAGHRHSAMRPAGRHRNAVAHPGGGEDRA